jgi:hypothetical protein
MDKSPLLVHFNFFLVVFLLSNYKKLNYIGQKIGKYSIIRLIGEGGMASVYEEVHVASGIKIGSEFNLERLVMSPSN